MWCRPLPDHTGVSRVAISGSFTHVEQEGHNCLGGILLVVANRGVPSHHLIEVVRLSTVLVSCNGRHPSHVIPRRQSRAFVMIEQSMKKRKQQLKQ